jgi:hypothetical protein
MEWRNDAEDWGVFLFYAITFNRKAILIVYGKRKSRSLSSFIMGNFISLKYT